jgi:hypothetical protein
MVLSWRAERLGGEDWQGEKGREGFGEMNANCRRAQDMWSITVGEVITEYTKIQAPITQMR